VISGLSSSIQYKFDALTNNSIGAAATRSPMSDLISPIGIPIAPVKPIAVAGNQEVTITVSALASGSPATSFTITANPNIGGKTCTVTGSSGSCKITGLINGTGYIFSAVAVNLAGTSTVSPVSDRVVPIAATPSPTPTPTPTPSPTPRPSASPTPSPSATPSPSVTPVVAPNAKLRLLFANGSSTLSVLARRQLDNVIGKIVDSVIDIQVLANGTIATGKITAKEKALSLKRAQAVAKYLQNQGLYGTYKVKGGVASTPASTAKNSVLVTLYWTVEK
jgi:outer membrane protein OmpA-like peptidoglycan-associated protein